MPFLHKETLFRVRSRWRTGSVAPCISWPSNEVTTSTSTTAAFGQDVLTETELSDWKKRIRLGVNATTRFVAENRNFSFTPGEFLTAYMCKATGHIAYTQIIGNLPGGISSVISLPSSPSALVSQKALTQAIQRAHSNARAQQGALKGSTVIAELRDVIRGIRNPASAMRRGIDDYAQAARRNARRANGGRSLPRTPEEFRRLGAPRRRAIGRALSGTWLEHNFGWIPLANDIGDAIVAGIRLSRRKPTARFSGRGLEESVPVMSVTEDTENSYKLKWNVKTYQANSVIVYGAVKLELATPATSAQEEFGLATKDFLPAVWEAIPYSFLVDYFTNVGEIVNALSFPKIDVAWVARTFRNQSIREFLPGSVTDVGNAETVHFKRWLEVQNLSSAHWSREIIDRISYGADLPLPSFTVEIPGSKNWKKWLNMAALGLSRVL